MGQWGHTPKIYVGSGTAAHLAKLDLIGVSAHRVSEITSHLTVNGTIRIIVVRSYTLRRRRRGGKRSEPSKPTIKIEASNNINDLQ